MRKCASTYFLFRPNPNHITQDVPPFSSSTRLDALVCVRNRQLMTFAYRNTAAADRKADQMVTLFQSGHSIADICERLSVWRLKVGGASRFPLPLSRSPTLIPSPPTHSLPPCPPCHPLWYHP